MRASNMARQGALSRVSSELQRKIGLKVLALGGNAVVAYREDFDFEGLSGMVARGIGTAILIDAATERSRLAVLMTRASLN